MSGKAVLLLLLLTSTLIAAPERRIALEEMRLELSDVAHQLKGQKTEIELLHDQINSFNSTIETLKEDKMLAGRGEIALEKEKGSALEKRVASLEKSQKTLVTDLKTLKDHLNASSETLAKCESRLASLDEQLSSDIKSLKISLQSMLALMQGGEKGEKTYIVQPGDSLGKIALDHHVPLKTLKEMNQLSSDQIVVGQKLLLNK